MKRSSSIQCWALGMVLVFGVCTGLPEGSAQSRSVPSSRPTIQINPVPRIPPPLPAPIGPTLTKPIPQGNLSSLRNPSTIFQGPKTLPGAGRPKIFADPKTGGSGIFGRPRSGTIIETRPTKVPTVQKLDGLEGAISLTTTTTKTSQRAERSSTDQQRSSRKNLLESPDFDWALSEFGLAFVAKNEGLVRSLQEKYDQRTHLEEEKDPASPFPDPLIGVGATLPPCPANGECSTNHDSIVTKWTGNDPPDYGVDDPPKPRVPETPEEETSSGDNLQDDQRQKWADDRERKKQENEEDIEELERQLLLAQVRWEMLRRDRVHASKHLPLPRR